MASRPLSPEELAIQAVLASTVDRTSFAHGTPVVDPESDIDGVPPALLGGGMPVDVPRMAPLTQLRYPGGIVQRGPLDGVRVDEPDDDGLRRRVGMRHARPGLAGGGLPDVVRQPLRRKAPSDDENTNAWGRQESIKYTDQPHEMARIQLDCSSAITVIVDNLLAGPGNVTPDVGSAFNLTTWVDITYGAGSTSVTRSIRCDFHLEISLLCSFCQVQAYVAAATTGQKFPNGPSGAQFTTTVPTAKAQVAVQVARGIIGKPDRPVLYKSQNAASGSQVFGGPVILDTIEAHLTGPQGGTNQFLQLFDNGGAGLVPDGTAPLAEWALGSTPSPGTGTIYLPDGITFSQDLMFAVSTTSGTKTLSGAAVWLNMWKRTL